MSVDFTQPIKYRLHQNAPEDPVAILLTNGVGATCPFAPVQIVMTQNGEAPGRMSCNTACPLVEMEKAPVSEGEEDSDNMLNYTIHCGTRPITRKVLFNGPSGLHKVEPAKIIRP